MASIENKLVEVILKRVRRVRTITEKAVATGPVNTTSKVAVREADFADGDQVRALNSRLGLGPDSLENWVRLWSENPAVNKGDRPIIGWVLVASNEIVGFLGSIPMLYQYERKVLRAGATCRLAVLPEYRAFTHLLITAFFRQKVDLLLDTTATVPAGKLMKAFKAVEVPQKDYGKVLFWILDARCFAKSVCARLGVNSPWRGSASGLITVALWADRMFRRRPRRTNTGRYTLIEADVNNLGSEYDEFWSEYELSRLRGTRTREIMRWHFDPPASSKATRFIGCRSNGRLVGYAVVQHHPKDGNGLRRSVIADMMVAEHAPEIIDVILAATLTSAKKSKSHVLEIMGFPEGIRRQFVRWRPYSRTYPSCPYLFKARDPELQQKLASESSWYACPFDGDATLWP